MSSTFHRRGARVPPVVTVVDSGADSQMALRWALREAAERECGVVAVSVVDPRRRSDWRLEHDAESALRDERDGLSRRVAHAVAAYEAATGRRAPSVELRVRRGDLIREVSKAARRAGLLVLGPSEFHDAAPSVHDFAELCETLLVDSTGSARRAQ